MNNQENINQEMKEKLFIWARQEGYNIELFQLYLEYQEKTRTHHKCSVEEYAFIKGNIDITDSHFLHWFSNWMSFGSPNEIPDNYSFYKYCQQRECNPYPNKQHYIVYDDSFLRPGFAIFREDDEQFFKIYAKNTLGFSDYAIVAKGNHYYPANTKESELIFQTRENDILYYPLKQLYETLQDDRVSYINHQVKIEKTNQGYNFVLTTEKNPDFQTTECIHISLGDYYCCKKWRAIDKFYHNLEEKEITNEEFVAEKVLRIGMK